MSRRKTRSDAFFESLLNPRVLPWLVETPGGRTHQIPVEITEHIIRFMDLESLGRLTQTCKALSAYRSCIKIAPAVLDPWYPRCFDPGSFPDAETTRTYETNLHTKLTTVERERVDDYLKVAAHNVKQVYAWPGLACVATSSRCFAIDACSEVADKRVGGEAHKNMLQMERKIYDRHTLIVDGSMTVHDNDTICKYAGDNSGTPSARLMFINKALSERFVSYMKGKHLTQLIIMGVTIETDKRLERLSMCEKTLPNLRQLDLTDVFCSESKLLKLFRECPIEDLRIVRNKPGQYATNQKSHLPDHFHMGVMINDYWHATLKTAVMECVPYHTLTGCPDQIKDITDITITPTKKMVKEKKMAEEEMLLLQQQQKPPVTATEAEAKAAAALKTRRQVWEDCRKLGRVIGDDRDQFTYTKSKPMTALTHAAQSTVGMDTLITYSMVCSGADRFPNLKVLHLNMGNRTFPSNLVFDLPNLAELRIDHYNFASYTAEGIFSEKLPKLRDICLHNPARRNTVSPWVFVAKAHALEYISVRSRVDQYFELDKVAESWPHIKRLGGIFQGIHHPESQNPEVMNVRYVPPSLWKVRHTLSELFIDCAGNPIMWDLITDPDDPTKQGRWPHLTKYIAKYSHRYTIHVAMPMYAYLPSGPCLQTVKILSNVDMVQGMQFRRVTDPITTLCMTAHGSNWYILQNMNYAEIRHIELKSCFDGVFNMKRMPHLKTMTIKTRFQYYCYPDRTLFLLSDDPDEERKLPSFQKLIVPDNVTVHAPLEILIHLHRFSTLLNDHVRDFVIEDFREDDAIVLHSVPKPKVTPLPIIMLFYHTVDRASHMYKTAYYLRHIEYEHVLTCCKYHRHWIRKGWMKPPSCTPGLAGYDDEMLAAYAQRQYERVKTQQVIRPCSLCVADEGPSKIKFNKPTYWHLWS